MVRRTKSLFSARAYRDIKPVPDRPGYWELIGSRPELELQTAGQLSSQGWARISFSLASAGERPSHCVLTVQTADDKQQLKLTSRERFIALVRVSPQVRLIRILLVGASGRVFMSPVEVRLRSKTQARIQLLTRIIVTNAWRSKDDKSALQILKGHGPWALLSWLTNRCLYEPGIDCPYPPVSANLDLFDDIDVADAACLKREEFLWAPQQPFEIDDQWSAARFCIDLLRTRADLRQRFPHALSDGPSGAFASWLSTEGRSHLHLTVKACNAIGDAFNADLANHIRQIYLTREELRAQIPFALTPAGRREFFHWLLREGRTVLRIPLESIWWCLLECAEQPSTELVRSYLFSPEWQRLYPEGATAFGQTNLAAWLVSTYGLDGSWVDPTTWPMRGTAAEHIRLAYALRPDWQKQHPTPFETLESSRAFVAWLSAPESGLTGQSIAWCRQLEKETVAQELVSGGINILGHFCYPSGLRTSVESLTEGLKRIGRGVALRDVWSDERDDPHHAKFDRLEYYNITLIHTQPEPYFDAAYARSGLQPRSPRTYRIGYWYWELDDIPTSWPTRAAQVDELWVATKYVADAMRKHFDLPVCQMMPGLELQPFPPRRLSYFNLPEDKFVFVFVFHMMSIMERKNPLGLIEAYRRAFGEDNRALLVLKTTFGEHHPDLMAELHAAVAGANVIIIDAIYTKDETLALMAAADCYVSLHRSEGWGLTMAEAMLTGRPVIATGYSGNMDFMDSQNSLLVDYDIVALEREYPPYPAGARWANPSVDHAARLMRQVFENRKWARDFGEKAKSDLRERLSLAASGKRMAARLAEIEAKQNARKPFNPRADLACRPATQKIVQNIGPIVSHPFAAKD